MKPGTGPDVIDGLLASTDELPPEALWELARQMSSDPRHGLESAIDLLRTTQARFPGDFWINHELGSLLSKPGRRYCADDAVRFVAIAVALRPDSPGAWYSFATALLNAGREVEAVVASRRAIELKPDECTLQCKYAEMLMEAGDLNGAIDVSRRVVELNPVSELAHFTLGCTLARKGDLNGAIPAYRRALELKLDFSVAQNNLGIVLQQQGDLKGATAAYRRAVELEPNSSEAQTNLGLMLMEQGDLNGATAACCRAVELKPGNTYAQNNLGVVLDRQGDLKGATAAYRRALELKPDYWEAQSNLGVMLRKQGDLQGAIAAYRRVLELRPDSSEAHNNLGIVLADQGELDAAIAAYRRALELKPDLGKARKNLRSVLRQKGELKAPPEFDSDTDIAEAHCQLGRVLGRCGYFAEALESLKRGHEIGSKWANWDYPSAEWIEEVERLVHLNDILLVVLHGQQKVSAAERIELAEFALSEKQMPQSAARLFRDAFAEDPSLAEDPRSFRRYNAACGVLLTSVPSDPPTPLNADRAAWRAQALDWLRAELAAWRQLADTTPDSHPQVVQALTHWRQDSDLVSTRDAEPLSRLPEAEQQQWRDLWDQVEQLRQLCVSSSPGADGGVTTEPAPVER